LVITTSPLSSSSSSSSAGSSTSSLNSNLSQSMGFGLEELALCANSGSNDVFYRSLSNNSTTGSVSGGSGSLLQQASTNSPISPSTPARTRSNGSSSSNFSSSSSYDYYSKSNSVDPCSSPSLLQQQAQQQPIGKPSVKQMINQQKQLGALFNPIISSLGENDITSQLFANTFNQSAW
jgi:hypothetical protein